MSVFPASPFGLFGRPSEKAKVHPFEDLIGAIAILDFIIGRVERRREKVRFIADDDDEDEEEEGAKTDNNASLALKAVAAVAAIAVLVDSSSSSSSSSSSERKLVSEFRATVTST